jgi:hypothetical protein
VRHQDRIVALGLKDDWFWAAIIIATPLVIFGMAEAVRMMRYRRLEALGRRSKDIPSRSGSGRFD